MIDASTRLSVRVRAGERCEYCRIHQNHDPFYRFHVEHIIARVHGGTNNLRNLALACHRCNEHKGPNLAGRDPRTSNIVRLFHPRMQRWARHFRFVGARIIGRTQVGRATVAVLAMNAADRVELRSELIAAGEFLA